jgi:hypothetical protein
MLSGRAGDVTEQNDATRQMANDAEVGHSHFPKLTEQSIANTVHKRLAATAHIIERQRCLIAARRDIKNNESMCG